MLRAALLVTAAALVVGCSSRAEVSNPFAGQPNAKAQMAAFAANSQYPSTRPSNDLRAMALVDRDGNRIRIFNASDQAITDAKVWVNGNYVAKVNSIPPHGSVTLNRDQFYDNTGRSLQQMQTAANRVELESRDQFYMLQGPVFD